MLSHSSPLHRIASLVSKSFISPRYVRATTCRPFSFRPWALCMCDPGLTLVTRIHLVFELRDFIGFCKIASVS